MGAFDLPEVTSPEGTSSTPRAGPATIGLAGKALELASLVPLVTILPRVLGPSDYGIFALGASLVTIAGGAASLGGPTMATRFVAAAAPEDRASLARAVIRRSALWRIGMAALVTIGVLLAGPVDLPAGWAALVVAAVAIDVVATLLLQAALPLGGVIAWSMRYPLQNAVLVVAALALHGSLGTIGAVAALPVASGAALALGAIAAIPRLRGAATARRLPQGMRRFALVQGAGGLMQLVLLRGAVLAVGLAGSSSAEVGYTALAIGIASALTYAVWQPYVVELPRLVAMPSSNARAWLERATRVVLMITVPALLVGILAAAQLVPRILGASFAGAVVPVGVAFGAVALAPSTAALNQAAALALRPEARLAASASGAVAFVVAAAAMVPPWDATGAAGALVVGTIVAALVGAVACADLLRLRETAASVAAAASLVLLALVT